MTNYETFKAELEKQNLLNDPTIHCISLEEAKRMNITVHDRMYSLIDGWMGYKRGEDKYFLFYEL